MLRCTCAPRHFLRIQIRALSEFQRKRFGVEMDENAEIQRYMEYGRLLKDQIVDGVSFIHGEMNNNKKLLVEGANAALLDIDFGTYVYTTRDPIA